jgi:methylglutaconyl-CoA hydratase
MSEGVRPVLREVAGPIARIVLNRPEKRNALDGALIAALRGELSRADADPEVRVITVTGAGTDFCAGADLAALQRVSSESVLENLEDVDGLAGLFLQIRHLRRPVVALVRGRALAGGCGLATACDLVLASEGASFGYPEVRIGFVPAMVMAILRRNLSEKRAFEMIATGDVYSAAEAERLGLVTRVYPEAGFDVAAEAFVATLAKRSASALQLSKRLLYNQDGMSFDTAIRAGADLNVLARMTEDTRDGVARFLAGGRAGE